MIDLSFKTRQFLNGQEVFGFDTSVSACRAGQVPADGKFVDVTILPPAPWSNGNEIVIVGIFKPASNRDVITEVLRTSGGVNDPALVALLTKFGVSL